MCPIAEETWRIACHELWPIQGANPPQHSNTRPRTQDAWICRNIKKELEQKTVNWESPDSHPSTQGI